MCAWQVFKYRMLLLRAADCGKNSSTLHQSVAPENEPAHKWTAFCISRSLLHSRIHVTYIVVNRYMAHERYSGSAFNRCAVHSKIGMSYWEG
jgi:hypothetical protein